MITRNGTVPPTAKVAEIRLDLQAHGEAEVLRRYEFGGGEELAHRRMRRKLAADAEEAGERMCGERFDQF